MEDKDNYTKQEVIEMMKLYWEFRERMSHSHAETKEGARNRLEKIKKFRKDIPKDVREQLISEDMLNYYEKDSRSMIKVLPPH